MCSINPRTLLSSKERAEHSSGKKPHRPPTCSGEHETKQSTEKWANNTRTKHTLYAWKPTAVAFLRSTFLIHPYGMHRRNTKPATASPPPSSAAAALWNFFCYFHRPQQAHRSVAGAFSEATLPPHDRGEIAPHVDKGERGALSPPKNSIKHSCERRAQSIASASIYRFLCRKS